MSVVRAVAVVSMLAGASVARAELAYGLTDGGLIGNLVSFDTASPGVMTQIGPISGMSPGFVERAIDVRPSTGQLYMFATAPGGAYEIHTLDVTSGAATRVGGGVIGNQFGWPIRVSMDFDPVTDQMRIVTLGARNNFRFSPSTGALIAEDARIAYVAGDVNAASNPIVGDIAYSNNLPGASSTTLFFYDYSTDSLARVGGVGGVPSADTGQMQTIGEAVPGDFLTLTAAIGMDISGATGVCYLSHDDVNGLLEQLSTVNLATGQTTLVGEFDREMLDIAIAVAPTTGCDSIDFNGNTVFPEDQDVIDFFTVLAGGACPTGTCNDIDFNNNQVFPEDQDVIDFFRVLAGGQCP